MLLALAAGAFADEVTALDAAEYDRKGERAFEAPELEIGEEDILAEAEEGHWETTHYEAGTHTEQKWIVYKAAWTETKTVTDTKAHDERVWVVDKKATTKTVVTGQRCETCGETRAK